MVVAGTASGVGKTTVATGLMVALRQRGTKVAAAKVGPDFIDPGYHALATGRPGRNLDSWMCGEGSIAPLAGRASGASDLLIIEGVMGLFDGSADATPDASTASIAGLLDAPIILVVDAASTSRSVAAVVHGFSTLRRDIRISGVVVNRVGSDAHESMVREALAPLGIPVLGALRRDDRLTWRDRHLGLVPVVEQPDEIRRSLDRLATVIATSIDLDAVVGLARSAVGRSVADPPAANLQVPPDSRPRIAIAGGPAFNFTYPDNLEVLVQAGAELLAFDPLVDARLPPGSDGLFVGGGFPEVFVSALASNTALLEDVRHQVASGLPTWAECGGLLWLARSLDGRPLAGVVPVDARMGDRLTVGYRRATMRIDTLLGPAGSEVRGHEFHYSSVDPEGDALALKSGHSESRAGFASPTFLASYLHLHLGGDPSIGERFVAEIGRLRYGGSAAVYGKPV
ncbi:MAG: cobyrinate a,c-diamide synthase [Acidimicrobiales bacterium]